MRPSGSRRRNPNSGETPRHLVEDPPENDAMHCTSWPAYPQAVYLVSNKLMSQHGPLNLNSVSLTSNAPAAVLVRQARAAAADPANTPSTPAASTPVAALDAETAKWVDKLGGRLTDLETVSREALFFRPVLLFMKSTD